MKEMVRTYTLASTAWPRNIWNPREEDRIADSLNIRVIEDGIDGEFHIDWINLREGSPPAPQIKAFDDAWKIVGMLTPLFAMLEGHNVQPEKLILELELRGFKPSHYHNQIKRREQDYDSERLEFERLTREHPEWLHE